MLQNPATKSPFTVVPGYSRLFRRGATYYFRVGVPNELRKAIGKTEIIKSLRTTEFRKAKCICDLESASANARFDSARRTLKPVEQPRMQVPALSDAEIHQLVVEWFIQIEKRTEEWWVSQGQFLRDNALVETVQNLSSNEVALGGGNEDYREDDGKFDLDDFLQEREMECPENSPAYHKLCDVFRRGRLENVRRALDRLTGKDFQCHDLLLKGFYAYSAPPASPQKSIKLGELLDRYLKFIQEHRSETTFMTYQTPARVMREIWGDNTPVAAISKESVEQFCALLKQRPKNAEQRYRGLTTEEAIAAAERKGDTDRLGPKALANYFRNIVAFFNFAVKEGYLTENPTSSPTVREGFRCKRKKKKKVKFTNEQMQAVFLAPIFTGCVDDERNFAKQGDNHPRRGRFWLMLLALFQGLRCNEACQLYAEDIKEKNGIPFIAVRTELDDEEITDKRLKNFSSIRNVPVHPTLIKIGFLDFVAKRQQGGMASRLFPELPAGKTGRYSNPFSKWFRRFLDQIFGENSPKATFHSFRHHFRDALRDGRISDENAEALGGWATDDEEQRHYGYGASLHILLEDISKVEYPRLDINHLFPLIHAKDKEQVQQIAPSPTCRTRTRNASDSPCHPTPE